MCLFFVWWFPYSRKYCYALFKSRFANIKEKLPDSQIKKTLKDFKSPEDFLKKTSSFGVVRRLLGDSNVIGNKLNEIIKSLYKVRKKLVHSASYIKSKDAKMCLKLFEVILKKKLKSKGIKTNNKKILLHGMI